MALGRRRSGDVFNARRRRSGDRQESKVEPAGVDGTRARRLLLKMERARAAGKARLAGDTGCG